jgi:hypothetical protein
MTRMHMDIMVLKKDLPKRLENAWKPLRLKPAEKEDKEEIGGGGLQGVGQEDARVEELAPEVAKELEKELEDQEYEIEKILDYVEEDGSRQYKVYRIRRKE